MQKLFSGFVLLVLWASAGADAYLDARAALIDAYESGDLGAMRRHAQVALDARPNFAPGLYNLALAQALDGDGLAALATLTEIQNQQIGFGVTGQEEFAGLKSLPGWEEFARREQRLEQTIGDVKVAASYQDAHFIPEGIAIDDSGRLWLGSIRRGDIVRTGKPTDIVVSGDGGPHWSVFAMQMHEGELWFVSAAVDEYAGEIPSSGPTTGLFTADPTSGAVRTRALLPPNGGQQVLGDFVFVDDDTLLLSDQTDGVIYRYEVGSGAFDVFVGKGVLRSPQGLALGPGEDSVYVADYLGGIFRIDLRDRAVRPVAAPPTINLYGIDGLGRYGSDLIAIQNGVRPHRVVRLRLARDGLRIVDQDILAMNHESFDEPTLGVVSGRRFCFIANSHWNRFDANHELPADLQGPIVLEIDLGDL